MEKLNFVELKESDLEIVKSIYDYYALNSTATFHTEAIKIEELKEFIYLNHFRYKSYLIQYENQYVGYCFLTHYKKRQAYDRTAEITLYLKPEWLGKGIGTAALTFMENVAKEVNINNLLAVITYENEQSVRAFSRQGYEKVGHLKNVGVKYERGLDVVLYQKQI